MARQKWFVEVGIPFPAEFFITAHVVADWRKMPQNPGQWDSPETAMLRYMYERVRIECELQWPGLQDWSMSHGEATKCKSYVAYDARRRSVLFVTGHPEARNNLVVSRAPFGGSPFVVEILDPPAIQLPIAVREVA